MHSVSVVIPVYRGEFTLRPMLQSLIPLANDQITPAGLPFRITEVIMVYDNGPDESDRVIRELSVQSSLVRPVWLSKNSGQHAATLAGMASSSGDWVVTMDEDGQQDPADIGVMLDVALAVGAQVVYGKPINPPPHGPLRNLASRLAKRMVSILSGNHRAADYNSYRLVLGSVARGVAAYAGVGVYLDVALGWIAGRFTTAPVRLSAESRQSGYTWRSLASHFWRMVISSGTRPLRLVGLVGALFGLVGFLLAAWVIVIKLAFGINATGWASTIVILLGAVGVILFSLAVIAEYVGVAVSMAMGKPPYFIVTDPESGPLRRAGSPTESE